jgi:hypothetical protein
MPMKLRETVRVIMHLSGEHTQVLVESTVGVGLAGGSVFWEIPTQVIPIDLRKMGSRFVPVTTSVAGSREAEELTADQIRSARSVQVERLPKT